jgi:hypothetical protein
VSGLRTGGVGLVVGVAVGGRAVLEAVAVGGAGVLEVVAVGAGDGLEEGEGSGGVRVGGAGVGAGVVAGAQAARHITSTNPTTIPKRHIRSTSKLALRIRVAAPGALGAGKPDFTA